MRDAGLAKLTGSWIRHRKNDIEIARRVRAEDALLIFGLVGVIH